MSRTLNARGVEPGGGSRGIHAPECRLAIKAASATGFLVEPWLTRRTLNANRHPAIQSKLLLRFRKNAVQEEFCNRARLHRLQKNSIREALCVRARLQSCRKQHKIRAGFSPCGNSLPELHSILPEDWPWSSFRHYATAVEATVEIESFWTGWRREHSGGLPDSRSGTRGDETARSENGRLRFVLSHPSAIKLRKDGAPNFEGMFRF